MRAMNCYCSNLIMVGLFDPERLCTRIHQWVAGEAAIGTLPAKASAIVGAVLYQGELPRGDLEALVGTGTAKARRIAATTLLDIGVPTAENGRAPLHVTFPATLALHWMPGLFPDKPR